MATLAAGSTVSVYCPLTGTMRVTPGTSGRVSINARGRDGSQSLAPRELYTAETLSVTAGDVVSLEAINVAATYTDPAESGPALQALVSGAGVRGRRVRSMLGAEAFDLMAVSGLPAGASFSGAGSYNSAGILAVQSSGTITHNATGWYDGSACLEFTPNTDSSAEFRIYNSTGLNISDDDGIAFEFGLPEPDTSKVNFSVYFDYSADATNLFPTNYKSVDVWHCDQTTATNKEKGGRKYIRQRWDYDATDANAGAFNGYAQVATGTGSDRTLLQKFVRFRMSKFSGKTLKFKAVRRGGSSMPCFLLGSDALNPEDLALRAYGYMTKVGLPSYINQYLSELAVATSLDRLRRIYAAGVEVNGNDVSDRPLGSTITDQTAMRSAIETTRDTLRGLGFTRGSRVWIANNNNSSYLMIDELQRAGYVANRNGETAGQYFIYPEGGVPDAYRLAALSLDNRNYTGIKVIVDRAILIGATFWMYWHGVLSTARIDEDRAANVTGTAGAPIARSGTETLQAYRARAAGLGTGAGNATVVYFDARIGSSGLGIWWEELKQLIDYLAPKNMDGSCVVAGPEEWCADVGLLTPAA